jgi:hypothetical protein
MSLAAARPPCLTFFRRAARRRAVAGPTVQRAGLLPIRQFEQCIGLTRAYAEAVDGPRATGLTEHSLSERVRARGVGILAGCSDRDGHGNRLDSGAAQRSGSGSKEQELGPRALRSATRMARSSAASP